MRTFDINQDSLDFTFDYNLDETNQLKDLFSSIRSDKSLCIDDLRRAALWKIDRVLTIPEDLISDLSSLAKSDNVDIFGDVVKDIIFRLTACDGVGFPMASAMLKFLRPDIFPIIDVRAYRALFGKKLYSTQYSIDLYLEYVKEIYKIRDKLHISLDKVDEQLYLFDKEYNGKI